MELSLFYFAFILFKLLSTAAPTEFDNQCPTSRRLLFFGGLNLSLGEKKSHHSSSSSKLPSSPPKYARSGDSRGLTVFIRPQTSNELGHKVRSFSHLLKSKLYTDEEKARLKLLQMEKKKQLKKKDSTQHEPSITTKTQELVAIDDDELNRCRALLHIDSTTTDDKKTKISKKNKSIKQAISSNIKNVTAQAAKNIKKKVTAATTTTALPINNKKVKITKRNTKTNPGEKKTIKISSSSASKTNENRPLTSPVINKPTKTASSSPPPPSESTINTNSKRNEPFDSNEDEIDDRNNSVVGRAYHFVKNMFQLSDDLLDDDNHSQEDEIIDITNEQQQHHHHSRKLLSIDEDDETSILINNNTNDLEFDFYLKDEEPIETTDDLSFVLTSIPKRQLLSVKTNKHSTLSKSNNIKDKKQKSITNVDANKPKVGWAYRYRISRFLEAQKMKRTGIKNKKTGGGKIKPSQRQQLHSKQNHKKTSSSSNTKVSKRKLLEYNSDDDSSWDIDEVSDQDIVNSVSTTKKFLPKRQLLSTKKTDKNEKKTEDESDEDKTNTRRRIKSFEELTDPVTIVYSYDRGLFKPRVGWQFRYRVSRYIDSLRENIREDQERLKLGLQAIKRKTPQELSGRRKRVLDKPFAPDPDILKKQEETIITDQENKPNVGWRYRYRISKMLEAKKRGHYIDDEEEKRKIRLEQKKKPTSHSKFLDDDDSNEYIEGENKLDPELRKINEEGQRVGWAYRYRIRRKLDHLKQQQKETGIPFDLATLSGKRDKKALELKTKSTEKKTTDSTEQKPEDKTKSVGWQYRYRVSKMREAQKHEKSKASTSKKQTPIPVHEQLDPDLARLTPEERVVGWKYRYRIRRKLDSIKNAATRENESGKRAKKSSRGKDQEKMMKKVEESIEKILNIDDIDETPFMEYFRRSSSYILSGLLPTAKKSFCLLPLPVTVSFCNQEDNDELSATTEESKKYQIKKLKTKKEHRAKQFIRSRVTKLGAEDKATERRVDEAMKNLYKTPSLPPLQTPPSSSNNEKTHKKQRIHPPKPSNNNVHEQPTKKMVGVESKKNKNKKQFQIIGTEAKSKHKHTTPSSTVATPSPSVEIPKPTDHPPLRSISEVIQQEAATILGGKRKSSRTPEEIQEEINETNESIQEYKKIKVVPPPSTTTTTTPLTPIDSTTSGEVDNDSTSSSDNDNHKNGENAKTNVHDDVLGLENDKNSA